MEKCIITKKAVEDLVKWTTQEFGSVRLAGKKSLVVVSFVGFRQVDVNMDIEIKAGVNMLETTEKLHQKLKTTLEKLAGLDLRYSKIKIRSLYYEPVEKQNA